ncbi:cytoplasmic protein [Methanomicrobiaceae archaeon CYW5]|uniref:YbgA family protein n=1 Tax=Methanovulcanius yangii TaxID=1789227 RepID=UPI0029CA5680|nr:DUF523 and DUF1722 domain-containing protein [Methanovulcanius yangii]MBT8507438.1 cytoplasmic protein [Methanovulcanius yangii]
MAQGSRKRRFTQPRVVISRCIEFEPVRYDGGIIPSREVARLKPYIEFLPVCPEVEIGLGIPRETIRIVRTDGDDHLIQPSTGRDVTREMQTFCTRFLDGIPPVDGFILKNRSPTSGINGVRIYPSAQPSAPVAYGPGFFGGEVLRRYPGYPIEDEGRLRNHRILDHFLTRIYTLADYRLVEEAGTIDALVGFHSHNKLLLMAHNQTGYQELGRLVGSHTKQEESTDLIARYRLLLVPTIARAPTYAENINVMLHSVGRFKHQLKSEEKAVFLDALESYRAGTGTLAGPKNILKSWIARFGDEYLNEQTFFAPYPDALMEYPAEETERGRDLWADFRKAP